MIQREKEIKQMKQVLQRDDNKMEQLLEKIKVDRCSNKKPRYHFKILITPFMRKMLN